MNRHERVQAALQGKKGDRVPVSAWGHFYDKERQLNSFVNTMLSFQEYYDWDYMKIHARASYHAEDWGCTYAESPSVGESSICTHYPIHTITDWRKIRALSVDSATLGEHLRAVKMIRKALQGEVPLIMTVFAPIMVAAMLTNKNNKALVNYIRTNPKIMHQALGAIAETFAKFVKKLKSIGVDGIFFATKQASADTMTAQEYREIARPYDLHVLEAAQGLSFNLLHICMNHIFFKELADYPVQVLHWDTHGVGNPSFAEGRSIVNTALAGGVSVEVMVKGSAQEIRGQARQALMETQMRGFLLGPSCSVIIGGTPQEKLWALRRFPEEAME